MIFQAPFILIALLMMIIFSYRQCNAPAFSGNGTLCARDSDGDTIPDIGLDCDGILCEKVHYISAPQ